MKFRKPVLYIIHGQNVVLHDIQNENYKYNGQMHVSEPMLTKEKENPKETWWGKPDTAESYYRHIYFEVAIWFSNWNYWKWFQPMSEVYDKYLNFEAGK